MNLWRRTVAYTLLAITIATAGSGCQYLEMVKSRRAMRAAHASEPRVALLRSLTPEEAFYVTGRLNGAEGHEQPMLVVAISHRHAADEVVAWTLVARDIELYKLLLPEGAYELVVLADLDGNGVFESTELIGATDKATPVEVDASLSRDGFLVDGPMIAVDPGRAATTSVPIHVAASRTGNVLPSLSDDFFARRWGQLGLFHPVELLVHTQGFLFGLEEPDPEKTQVLFVHGAGGVPAEFAYLVEGLDRTRFQPWFFFYPSGLPLGQTASALSEVLEVAVRDLGLRHVAIVAYSMGGLVAHAALNQLCRERVPEWLTMFTSIATPYGGHPGALLGVERASEVIPSWRDVAPDSPFLRDIYARPLPAELPFYLLFAYDNRGRLRRGPSGDGIVTMRSQLELPVHLRAWRSFGVDATHIGVLTDPAARQIVVDLLAKYAPARQ